tara:strand:- start:452 stop:718 length:267 start_codon:yes stop_codon:yes gene_type:complete
MGTVHLLKEMMVFRFDGGAHQPQNEETTMLNTSEKFLHPKSGNLQQVSRESVHIYTLHVCHHFANKLSSSLQINSCRIAEGVAQKTIR